MNFGNASTSFVSATEQVEATAAITSEALTGERLSVFRACCRQLWSPTPRTRGQAAERLGDFGQEALEPLRLALRDVETEVQVAAVGSLTRVGGLESEELLVEALRSEHAATRLAAVAALSEVGGADALDPLISYYHRCFLTRSARRDRWVWPLLGVGFIVAIIVFSVLVIREGIAQVRGLVWPIVYFGLFLAAWRQRSAPRKMLDSLLKVAERSPSAELLKLLPELRAVAENRLLYGQPDRDAYRVALERVEALAAPFQSLPLPAVAPNTDPVSLPVPARPPRTEPSEESE